MPKNLRLSGVKIQGRGNVKVEITSVIPFIQTLYNALFDHFKGKPGVQYHLVFKIFYICSLQEK